MAKTMFKTAEVDVEFQENKKKERNKVVLVDKN